MRILAAILQKQSCKPDAEAPAVQPSAESSQPQQTLTQEDVLYLSYPFYLPSITTFRHA